MTISACYGPLGLALFGGQVDYLGDTIKGMLLTSTYTPDQDNHDNVSDVSGSELSGAGYTAGGMTLANKTLTYDPPTNKVKLDCDDLMWAGTTWTDVRYLVFYDATTGNLLSYVDFETAQSTSAAPFTYMVPDVGFLNVTVV